jgi:hypothetical protein
MERLDQTHARKAAAQFIEQNAGGDRLMAVGEFGGSLLIKQDFTANYASREISIQEIRQCGAVLGTVPPAWHPADTEIAT